MFFSAKSPYCKSILGQHGPDDLLSATVSQNPLSHLIIDETGPVFYADPSAADKFFSAHILVGVELVTYRTHLVVINSMATIDVIRGLEMFQNLRGSLINVIMDHHSSHVAIQRQGQPTPLNRPHCACHARDTNPLACRFRDTLKYSPLLGY